MSNSTSSVLVRGGRIVDGTGNPWFYADVLLEGDRIRAIERPGQIDQGRAHEVIEAAGLVVCPGFIDIQSHSIIPLMVDGRCLSKVTQGVTTEVMGEAWTPAPVGGRFTDVQIDSSYGQAVEEWEERARGWHRFGDWLEAMEERGVTPNVGSFLGGGTLRQYAKGMDMGALSPAEMETTRRIMTESMEDGAFGVSYALIYAPDTYADTEELVAACDVVARYGGVYITHIRSEAAGLLEAIDEAVDVGRRASLPVEIYHLKASGRRNWHKMPQAIDRIERARASGIDVTADMYPYVASGTGLSSLIPTWVAAGGSFYENLQDPEIRRRVREDVENHPGEWDESRPDGIMPLGFYRPENKQYAGKRLSDISAMRGQDWLDSAMDLLVSEDQRIFTVFFSMTEENLRLQVGRPWIKFSSDAGGLDPAWAQASGMTHPRAYGTFTRVLAKYVREDRLLTLEDAVRKMSGAVAQRLGLKDRGFVLPGMHADLVILDPSAVQDHATFEEPHHLSTGVRDVWVNGTRVLKDGTHTGALPGRFVRGPGAA